jgi:phosphatidylglycerophosphate synthase
MRLSLDERVRLQRAVKQDDSPFTTFAVSPWSKYIAWWASRRGLTPNQVTVASLAVALLAAACCAVGARWGYVAGAVLLQVSFGLDCADGQLARLTRTFSEFGGWLDAMADRLKEYAVYAGLAVGSARAGDDVWPLAVTALVLQTLRHAVDFSWSVTPASTSAVQAGAALRAAGRRRRWHWARKVAILPIGERWALISVLVALTDPRVVFVVLIAAGVLAGLYMVLARVRRSLGRLPGTRADADAAALVQEQMWEAGPVVRAVMAGRRPPGPRWGWVVPPLLRAGEYGVVVAAASLSGAGVGAACYAYLLALVWHHYDSANRLRRGTPGTAASPTTRFAGVELRTIAIAALAVAGARVFSVTAATLAVVIAVLAVAQAWTMWRSSGLVSPLPEGDGGRP